MFAYLVMVGGGSDGTIISADSLGQVIFWDGKSLAQIKSFKAHAADAQCLVISPVSPVLVDSHFDARSTG
jgi:U3 small nucleolar RNA-associated protein 4